MAKATAICTCIKCNATFKKTAYKANRRDADSWEEWAKSYYDECPDCYKAEQQEKEIENCVEIIEMHYGDYKNKYSDCKTVQGSYNGDTKTIKVIVSKKHRAIEKVLAEFPELKEREDLNRYMNWAWENRKTANTKTEKGLRILEILNSED